MNNQIPREDDFAFVYLDVDDPQIAWLAYRGIITSADQTVANPGNLSWHLVNTIQRGVTATLRREGILEGVRRKKFGHKLSRLRCVYAHPTLEAAAKAAEGRGKFRQENLVSIAPRGAYVREQYDSEWATNFDALEPEYAAREYWSHGYSKNPVPELLLSGNFSILGTLVRERAYATVKKESPDSLAMLELARLGAELGSHLGAIAPWIGKEDEGAVVTSLLRYDHSEGTRVLKEALERNKANQDFRLNWKDLEPLRTADPEFDPKFSTPAFRMMDKPLRIDKAANLEGFIAEATL